MQEEAMTAFVLSDRYSFDSVTRDVLPVIEGGTGT